MFNKARITIAMLLIAGAGCAPVPILFGLAEETGISPEKTASVYLLPDYQAYFDPDNLFVDIMIDPGGQPINVFSATVGFAPALITAEGWEYNKNFSWLWLAEEANNQNGTFRLVGGTPGNSIGTTTTVARLRFKKISPGWTTLTLSDVKVLAADGLGTNIPVTTEIHRLFLYQ